MGPGQYVDAIDLEEPEAIERFSQMCGGRPSGVSNSETLRCERDPPRVFDRENGRHQLLPGRCEMCASTPVGDCGI
jgi:hypothetical protein